MLVHVEHEHRPTAGERGRVVGGPLIYEPLVARRVGKDHPPRAAALRLAHGGELGAPALDAAKIACDGVHEATAGRAATAETIEVDLVQNHRIRSNELLTLESVDDE